MEFTLQVTPEGEIVPKTGLTNITEQRISKMPVSEGMRLLGFIATEWNLNLSRKREFDIAYRMLVQFAKYN